MDRSQNPLRASALLALVLAAAPAAAETFTYRDITYPDGVPGYLRAVVDKREDKYSVRCNYSVTQEAMDLPNMPLGSYTASDIEKGDRDTARQVCLDHYYDAIAEHYH